MSADLRDAQFIAIVEGAFDAIISKDLRGTVQSWNPAAERIFGWSANEIVGNSIRSIIPPDLIEEEDRILARIRAGERVPKFETIRLHKSGTRVPVAITLSPMFSKMGDVIGASKIASDITAIAELRVRLEASEDHFRMLANNIPQLAWIADQHGMIFWYNDRWYEYTGTTLDQMYGWGWTGVHHPDHVERVKARIQEAWDTGVEWEDTFPLRGRDGSYRWFLSRAKPLFDNNGKVWRWFGTNTDITIQRENEEKIRLLMGEVNHRAKNMIAIVQAVVSRTANKQFAETLAQRLQALSRNQDLLTKGNWKGTAIGELITSQLVMVEDLLGSRIFLEGDLDFLLSPSASETIGLAIHELSTNAAKYGALSGATGKIAIRCAISQEAGEEKLLLSWDEFDGPAVTQPKNTGFGTVMIERNPRFGLGADVQFGFPPAGFFWKLAAPLDRVKAT